MILTPQRTQNSALSKGQWLSQFVETFQANSQHFMSERSVRGIALREWEANQAASPAEVAQRWNSGISRSR